MAKKLNKKMIFLIKTINIIKKNFISKLKQGIRYYFD